mmetsp:Transcript_31094/g.77721  ORF Transcript_31094/g.77721 Transcript_31094/m.77721 type:complete len:214 (+) Transcript_31094:363-1004(+)
MRCAMRHGAVRHERPSAMTKMRRQAYSRGAVSSAQTVAWPRNHKPVEALLCTTSAHSFGWPMTSASTSEKKTACTQSCAISVLKSSCSSSGLLRPGSDSPRKMPSSVELSTSAKRIRSSSRCPAQLDATSARALARHSICSVRLAGEVRASKQQASPTSSALSVATRASRIGNASDSTRITVASTNTEPGGGCGDGGDEGSGGSGGGLGGDRV